MKIYHLGGLVEEWLNGDSLGYGRYFECDYCRTNFSHTWLELWMLENGIIGGHQCRITTALNLME